MLKISKNLSTTLSLALAVFFFVCCTAGLFILPALTEMLINLPDNIGNRGSITSLGRTLCLVSAYAIVLDMMLAKRKMTSLELAQRVGMTPANLSILKTGKAKAVRMSTLDAICRELKCQPGEILEYVDEDDPRLK